MLLMKENVADRSPLPAQTTVVPAGTAGSIAVRRGQLLRIEALEEGAVASLFGFSDADPMIHLSVHHTRVFSNSYVLGSGMRLVNNRRRPVMVLGKDSIGKHDLLLPASTTAYLRSKGYDGIGCVEALQAELQRLGRQQPKLPDPVNLFMHVELARDGSITPQPNRVKAGDKITCRVVQDMLFVVSTCCTGVEGNDRPAAVALSVAEDLDSFVAQP
ncbi:urea carboxylase-associated family protein [Pseudomonas sp. NPDC089554]|uniref:urea carboxylase-associated family protein n=1 Tax=Pseudomonas sp. NPDC089554 TaxID=3390653 RepID=UPI003D00CC48